MVLSLEIGICVWLGFTSWAQSQVIDPAFIAQTAGPLVASIVLLGTAKANSAAGSMQAQCYLGPLTLPFLDICLSHKVS